MVWNISKVKRGQRRNRGYTEVLLGDSRKGIRKGRCAGKKVWGGAEKIGVWDQERRSIGKRGNHDWEYVGLP